MSDDYQVRRIAFGAGVVSTSASNYTDPWSGWAGYFQHLDAARAEAVATSAAIGIGLYDGEEVLEHSWFSPTGEGRAASGVGEWATTVLSVDGDE